MAVLHGTSLVAGLLAVDPEGPNADKVSPGLLGFITVFCLALAVVLLVRSMTKHLRKVRYTPGPDGQIWTPPGTVGSGPTATTTATTTATATAAEPTEAPPETPVT